MSYCINCGQELITGAKFCANCGSAVNSASNSAQRKIIYDGEIHKCPSCGEGIKSFETNCPSCGYELRGAQASNAIKELSLKLENATSESQKITIIRSFPVPNTKEDIFEFMILASSNFDALYYAHHLSEEDISDAWLTKIEQCYRKAKLSFSNDSDFIKFQNIYDQINKEVKKEKNIRVAKNFGNSITKSTNTLPQAIVALGWIVSIFVLIPLCGENLDVAGTNSYQLLLMLNFILGSIFIPVIVRGNSTLPSLITVVGLILSIVVLIPLCGENLDVAGFNAYQMIIFVDIIVSLIIFVRIFKKRK